MTRDAGADEQPAGRRQLDAGRVADLVRSASCQLSARLARPPLDRGGQQAKLISCRRDARDERQERAADAPAQRQGHSASRSGPMQTLGGPCWPTASGKQMAPRLSRSLRQHDQPQLERSTIAGKRLTRKLDALLGKSLLADLMPGSPVGQRPAQVLKFTRHNEPLQDKVDLNNNIDSNSDYNSDNNKGEECTQRPPNTEQRRAAGGRAEGEARAGQRADLETDGGYAWVILAVIFIINASTFGTARAYGLIFERLARDRTLNRTEAAMPFTIMGAIENMAGPLSGYLLARSNNSWRATVFAGSCLITLAHLFAALAADSMAGQLLSLGLMCGLGMSLVSISFFQLNNAYFVRYRSTALGLGMTGAAFGTLYISPLCQYFLDTHGTSACYLMLSAILAPNVPLSLLLKPKAASAQTAAGRQEWRRPTNERDDIGAVIVGTLGIEIAANGQGVETTLATATATTAVRQQQRAMVAPTVSRHVDDLKRGRRSSSPDGLSLRASIKRVVCNPMFHLIWPTQLLFCWLNFVFGMIIVDFGRERLLNTQDLAHLVPCWAFGQLVGRLFLSSLVDFKCLSYKSFTVICFLAISITTYLLNDIRLPGAVASAPPPADDSTTVATAATAMASAGAVAAEAGDALRQDQMTAQLSSAGARSAAPHLHVIFLALVFVLSMFIALLFILFNGLVVRYVEPSLQPLSIGISSFTGSFFLLPRANIIGHYHAMDGNYDSMLAMFAAVSMVAALTWLVVPYSCAYLKRLVIRKRQQMTSCSRARDNLRVYSNWKLNDSKLSRAPVDIRHHHNLLRQQQQRQAKYGEERVSQTVYK